eukprot:14625478-Ditylum_brightwellii.AAC.1
MTIVSTQFSSFPNLRAPVLTVKCGTGRLSLSNSGWCFAFQSSTTLFPVVFMPEIMSRRSSASASFMTRV